MIHDLQIWNEVPANIRILNAVKEGKYATINVFGGEEHNICDRWTQTAGFRLVHKFAKRRTLNVVLGCVNDQNFSQRNDECKFANYHFWPTFWISYTVHNQRRFLHHSTSDTAYEFNYSLFNSRPHDHRCMLVDELAKQGILSHGAVSWHEPNVEYNWKHWSPERLVFNSESDKELSLFDVPDEMKRSFCQVVSESTTEVTFVTEKTVMPILSKMPFIAHAAPGFHLFLKSLGILPYTEIFNYSFDSISCDLSRAAAIAENVNRLSSLDLNEVRRKIEPKLEHNRNRILEIATDPSFVPEIVFDYLSRSKNSNTTQYIWLQEMFDQRNRLISKI